MNTVSVQSYTPLNWLQIAPLVESWQFKQSRLSNESQASVLESICTQVRTTLGNKDSIASVAIQGKKVHGFAGFRILPWDSEQLGIPAARVEYLVAIGSYEEQRLTKDKLLESVMGVARDRGVWHLSTRVDSSDLSSLHAYEEAGFITVDGILTFACDLSVPQPAPAAGDFTVRLATADDATEAGDLARHAYVLDRFHSDPFIACERADELHATWVRNAFHGTAADTVFVAEDETGLLGFVTCALNRKSQEASKGLVGTIVLVATAEPAKGRGVARAVTMAAMEWFRAQGCTEVEVGTQTRNIAACRLYQKCGFNIVGSSTSLRKLL
jgi:dTDP-4-amino-4,6-dideoxy-D-galactose acyltransferase